jgi:hypothetical protein
MPARSFFAATAGIVPSGHTEERVGKISATIAPLLRRLGNLIEKVEERYRIW